MLSKLFLVGEFLTMPDHTGGNATSLPTATRRYLMERMCDVFMWQAATRQAVMSELAVCLYRCVPACISRAHAMHIGPLYVQMVMSELAMHAYLMSMHCSCIV